MVARSRGGDPSWGRLGPIVLGTWTADWPSVLKSLAFKGSFSIDIHLLDIVNIGS